jgi:hypothetical protein
MDTKKPASWSDEDNYWRTNYAGRSYAGQHDYDYFRPGFQYGHESAQRYPGRYWNDVEKDLESGWSKWEHRGNTAWREVREAVRDAWTRVMGRDRETAQK